MKSQYVPCPFCGLPNIRERRICKRCRRDMATVIDVLVPGDSGGDTGHLYRDGNGTMTLFICANYIEFASRPITIRSTWMNITDLQRHGERYWLVLGRPAVIRELPDNDENLRNIIPLWMFGYPRNPVLAQDIRLFAPNISRY